jgi:DNA-binding transcriptional ArsR family regulator
VHTYACVVARDATVRLRQAAAEALEEAIDISLCVAVAEPARRQILQILLREGASDIGVIAAQLSQDRSVVSRHLKQLHDAGLVRLDRDGRRRVYRLDGAGFVTRLEQMAATIRRCMMVCCPEELPAAR